MEDKKRVAVAIKYDKEVSSAPIVTAVGTGVIADKIVEKAKESKVPIQNNPELAAMLSQLNIGQEIPEELYVIVAEILAFVYNLDNKWDNVK